MAIKIVLFDLDGTLLPMDQNVFVKAYFGGLAKKLAPLGYESKKLIDSIWFCTEAMVKNNGLKTNEKIFWEKFSEIYGDRVFEDAACFEKYYYEDFDNAKESCGYNPEAAKIVAKIKDMGLRVVLATNPLFPSIATEKRLAWAGLEKSDFELYTTYENFSYAKPNPKYYCEILKLVGAAPEEALMVGNDVSEDMVAETIGMKVFLLTDNLINKEQKDISAYPQGTFSDLMNYIIKNA